MLKACEGDKSPALVIFAVRSSHWQQRTGRRGSQKEELALGVTSEIYLLERVLWGGAAMVTSELR